MTTRFRANRALVAPERSIGIVDDDVHGYALGSAALGFPFVFGSAPVFRVRIYDRSANTVTLYGPPSFTISGDITTFPVSFRAALTVDARCVIEFTAVKTPLGVKFGFDVLNTSPRYAVQTVEWPRFNLRPWGDDKSDFYLVHTMSGGGYTLNRPQDYAAQTLFGTWPPGLPFVGFFEAASKRCLMLWADDEVGRQKLWSCDPNDDADGVVVGITTFADRRYDAANAWDPGFSVHMEAFTSKCRDGRTSAYDFALRYRKWATTPGRPSVRGGRWWENPNVAEHVAAADMLITISGVDDAVTGVVDADDCTRITTDLGRFKTAVAPASPIISMYGWRGADFNKYWPDPDPLVVGLLAAVNTMNTTLLSAGWFVWFYAFFRNWSVLIPSGRPFRVDAYSTALTSGIPSDLRPYLIKKRDGTNKSAESGNAVTVDWTHPVWGLVAGDVIRNTFAAFTYKPFGSYLDAFGPFLPASFQTDTTGADGEFDDQDGATDWTWRKYRDGFADTMQRMKDKARIMRSDWGYSSEVPDERTIPVCDLTFLQQSYTGAFFPAWMVVYGDYQRVSDFNPVALYNSETQSLSLSTLIANQWLATGIVAFNHGVHLSPSLYPGTSEYLVAATYNQSPLYYAMEMMKSLKAAFATFGDYFRGHMTRPVLTYIQGDAAQQTTNIANWFATGQSGTRLHLSETWKRYDGALGVLIVSLWPSDTSIANAGAGLTVIPALPAVSVSVSFDTALDDLPAGTKTVRLRNAAGTTTLGTFTQRGTFTATIPSGSVSVIEAVVL